MSTRKVLYGKAVDLMIFFCAILGMQQIAIKAAAPDMAPVLQIAIRSGMAALIIGLYLRMKDLPLLHGGVITSLADVSCGYAALTTMPDDSEVLTVEFKINLLRPASKRKIIATGQVIKSGRMLVISESTVTDEGGETIIAKMLATMIVSHVKR